jgi:UDP-N-acetylmuramate dehydrogenase
LVIHNNLLGISVLSSLQEANTDSSIVVKAMAGVIWDEFVAFTLQHGYYGLENLSLIPGTVGAAPIQNIGAYGVEVKDFIKHVECFDLSSGKTIEIANKDCNFSYRNSRFKLEPNLLVTAVVFRLKTIPQLNISYGDITAKMAQIPHPTPLDLRKCIIETRTSKLPDPRIIPNVGSFFHNPILSNDKVRQLKSQYSNLPVYTVDDSVSKISAGWLIDNAGFKGYKYKNVGVYSKQALVLVNYSATTRCEILELAAIIKDTINAKYGISLNIEPLLV